MGRDSTKVVDFLKISWKSAYMCKEKGEEFRAKRGVTYGLEAATSANQRIAIG